MHEIKLIDKADRNSHASLEYTVPDAKASIWTGRFPIAGRVSAFMCEGCGRIALYGTESNC